MRRLATVWEVRESNPGWGKVFGAVQTGPKALPDSCTIGAAYFAGVKRQKADPRSWSAPLPCWDFGFKSSRKHGCLSLVCAVCCQVQASASGLITRPEESYRVWCMSECDRGTSQRRHRPTRVVEPWKKKSDRSILLTTDI